jgi:hypothetical protein
LPGRKRIPVYRVARILSVCRRWNTTLDDLGGNWRTGRILFFRAAIDNGAICRVVRMKISLPLRCTMIIKEVVRAQPSTCYFFTVSLSGRHDVFAVLTVICEFGLLRPIRIPPICFSPIWIKARRTDIGILKRNRCNALLGCFQSIFNSLGISEHKPGGFISSVKEIDVLDLGKPDQCIAHLISIDLSS